MGQGISLKSERNNHDLTAHTINGVCHSIRSMFRVLGIYNFNFRAYFVWAMPENINFISFHPNMLSVRQGCATYIM